jgi:glutamine amidotransferase
MNVGVVDYGMGNLHSVAKALALQKVRVSVTQSRKKLQSSDLLVLPGVGSFGAAMKNLARLKLDDFLRQWIPHMGWNNPVPVNGKKDLYFRGISATDYFYFVHSYYPVPSDSDVVATTTRYGKPFCSAVAKGNLFASQFHPEKSGETGLKLLSNVVRRAA